MGKAKKHFSHPGSEKPSTVSKGRIIEAIVASMHEKEGMNVERNVKLPPINGSQGPAREVDVLLSTKVCGYPVRWAFECKNYKKRIGVEYIDAFVGKLKDVGIPSQFGIFVTSSDYSKGAQEQAKKEGIRLLTIKDVLHHTTSDIQHAVQSTIFLLPIIDGLECQNFVLDATMTVSEAMMLFNKQGEVITVISDAIWQAWNDGRIRAEIGKSDIELTFPDEVYQRVNGKLTPVTRIVVKVTIVALVLQISSVASLYRLENAITGATERERFQASFSSPLHGTHHLKTIASEEQLEQEICKPAMIAIANRIRLPRINFWNTFYWPLSERVMKIITERMRAFEAGSLPDPRPFHILELEGADLSAVFEPISLPEPVSSKTP